MLQDVSKDICCIFVHGKGFFSTKLMFTLQVPELAGSWLLTLLIQFPLILLLLFNEDPYILPFERAANMIEGLFIVFEILCGYFAIRVMVDYQVTKFHIRQFTDLEHMPDDDYWLDEGDEAHEHYA